jgi:hypothetical protein
VEGDDVSAEERAQLEEMGPVDYVILEWPQGGPTPELAPMIIDLVDRGLITLLDVAFVTKDDDGTITAFESVEGFEGASSGLLDAADLEEAGRALEPGSSAAVLVWENRWLAPVAIALRRSGAQLVDSGRLSIQGLIAALDALEATAT